jgi:hypothetical protein
MQGKSNKQYSDSAQIVGLATMIGLATLLCIGISHLGQAPTPPEYGPPHNYWVPTEEDQRWLDSLYMQVKETEADVDTLNASVDRIESKLDNMIEER